MMYDELWTSEELESYAEGEWAMMSEEERKEYGNDYDSFVTDLWFCFCV